MSLQSDERGTYIHFISMNSFAFRFLISIILARVIVPSLAIICCLFSMFELKGYADAIVTFIVPSLKTFKLRRQRLLLEQLYCLTDGWLIVLFRKANNCVFSTDLWWIRLLDRMAIIGLLEATPFRLFIGLKCQYEANRIRPGTNHNVATIKGVQVSYFQVGLTVHVKLPML